MKNLLQSILVIAGVILLEVFADQIPPVVRLSRSLEEQPQPYLTVAIVMSVGSEMF